MNLDNLKKIEKVDTPPFLFTRIQQKIEQSKKERMPKHIALALGLTAALLLAVNAMVLVNYNSKANATESLAKSMHLTSNNSLY